MRISWRIEPSVMRGPPCSAASSGDDAGRHHGDGVVDGATVVVEQQAVAPRSVHSTSAASRAAGVVGVERGELRRQRRRHPLAQQPADGGELRRRRAVGTAPAGGRSVRRRPSRRTGRTRWPTTAATRSATGPVDIDGRARATGDPLVAAARWPPGTGRRGRRSTGRRNGPTGRRGPRRLRRPAPGHHRRRSPGRRRRPRRGCAPGAAAGRPRAPCGHDNKCQET